MKLHFLLPSFLVIALTLIFNQNIHAAGATSSQINNAIVQAGTVAVTWENDDVYPWILENGKLKSGNAGCKNTTSRVAMKYKSEGTSTLSFTYDVAGGENANHLLVIIDGEKRIHSYNTRGKSMSYRLPKGNHTVEFCDTVYGYTNTALCSYLYDVKVIDFPGASPEDINSTIVKEGSVPVTWTNDESYPWQIVDGKLRSGNALFQNSNSKIAFKYSSQYPTTVNFKYDVTGGPSTNRIKVYIDGTLQYLRSNDKYDTYDREGVSKTYRLPKGNHIVEVCDTMLACGSESYYSRLYDVSVTEYPGASDEEVNNAIVQEGSLPLTWILDDNYPWRLNSENKLYSGNWRFPNSRTKVAFKYSSQYPTTVNFKYDVTGGPSTNKIKVYIDGTLQYLRSNDKYDTYDREGVSKTYRLPKGNHIIEVCDTMLACGSESYYSRLYDVKVTEPERATPKELSNGFLLSEQSIIWENDTIFPLGYIEDNLSSTNAMWENSKSSLKAHVYFEKPSVISFDWRVGYDDYNNNHIAKFYVDGFFKYSNSRNTAWATNTIALSAGEHTLHWEYSSTTPGSNYWMQLRNLTIASDWVSVETSPGLLGVETLYKVDRLQDVNFLKIKGSMNDADWKVIKQMVNLYGLDLSETDITTLPVAFNSNADFGYIVLPKTLLTIPDKAFRTCKIHEITIPASVKTIGNEAFASTYLGFVDFAENSQLTTIGYRAFYNTDIKEFIMPNSVTKLTTLQANSSEGYRSEAFASCSNLRRITFSDNLVVLPRYLCAYSGNIKEIHLPVNLEEIGDGFMEMWKGNTVYKSALESIELPSTLKRIGADAFSYVQTLKAVELPETLKTIGSNAFIRTKLDSINFPQSLSSIGNSAFSGCPLESVILPSKLRSLGEYAFANNEKVKNIVLPSGITNYDNQFKGCKNIETINCLCATPPAIMNDPFGDCDKSSVTLKVPQFAVATYKLDPYWYQFDNILEGEPTDYWKIIGDLKLLNNRRMEGKPDVDLYYGGKLTVKGDAAMPIGKFDIYTSEDKPSSFVTDCANITADEINTIFSVSANRWYFLTPMVDVDLQQVIVSGTTNYVFRYYDGATRADIGAGTSWKNVSDMKLKAGVGYIFQCNAAGTLTFPVPVALHKNILTTEAVVLPLTPHPSDNKANKGWNYVGNPFPSYFDIHYMDFTAPITVWTGSTYKAYSIADDRFVLRPMQGFFVQKPDAVDRIVLHAAGRQIESTVNRPNNVAPSARVSAEQDRFIFNIEIATDTLSDATRIVLNEEASAEYELECDAAKFMSIDQAVPQIYTIDNNGNRLAINERPAVEGEIALGVYIPKSSANYSISAGRIDGEAYLYDAETGITHDFAEGSYAFSAEEGTDNKRFTIKLKGGVPTQVEDVDSYTNVQITSVDGGLEIRGASGRTIKIVTVEGLTIYSSTPDVSAVEVPLSVGIYVVTVDNRSYKVIVK